MEPTILVLGNANVDVTSYVTQMPSNGETVVGYDFTMGMGGKGSNQAVACSRAGAQTAFVGSIGKDTFGEIASDILSGETLDLSYLQRSTKPTGVANITVDRDGANRICVFLGASEDLGKDAVDAPLEQWGTLRFFVSQLELPLATIEACLLAAHERGVITVLNTAPFQPLSPALLHTVDWLIGNEIEIQQLLDDQSIQADLDEPVELLAQHLPQWSDQLGVNLVITLGEKGAMGCVRGEKVHFSPATPVSALDTVGAGDCFVGFFVASLDAGFRWQHALDAAVWAATTSVQTLGAQSSYPTGDQWQNFLQTSVTEPL